MEQQVIFGDCEFCATKNVPVTPVGSFLGWYCQDCAGMLITEAMNAEERIQEFKERVHYHDK